MKVYLNHHPNGQIIRVPKEDGTSDFFKDPAMQWLARVSGPWYDDSDIEAQGHTREEAIANAMNDVRLLKEEAEELLAKYYNGITPVWNVHG